MSNTYILCYGLHLLLSPIQIAQPAMLSETPCCGSLMIGYTCFDILIDSITSIQVNYYTKLLPQPKFHKQQKYLDQNNW
jgi:hypothetical protein